MSVCTRRDQVRGGVRAALLLDAFVLVFLATQLRAETTIYVGKHFEIRDHDAPVKYVFNGNTRVARVTGSLSANERIQRLRLRPGWNLVSLAVTVPDFLGQVREFTTGPVPVINALYQWRPATKDYRTITAGESVAAGSVLWILAQAGAVMAVHGEYVESTEWRAPANGTFLAVPALEAQPLIVPPGVALWRYEARSGDWQLGLTEDLASVSDLPSALAPGEAIFVQSNEPTDLGAPPPEERIHYYHQDHLGSSSVMTDADGAVVEETAFYPFGIPRHEHLLRRIEELYKFTQKERDRESGLDYFEARYLAVGLARFITQDPKYANPDALKQGDAAKFLSNPQKMNMYAYAHNNPLNYVDPSGLDDMWDLVQAGAAEVARTTRDDPRERQYTSFFMGASDSLAWGMGGNYKTMRTMIADAYKVDTDSTAYDAGKWSGKVFTMAITLFLPGPKAAGTIEEGTVFLYSKKPMPSVEMPVEAPAANGPFSGRGNTIAAESDIAGQAAARANAAANAAAKADFAAYSEIVGAQRQAMMQVYEGLGITPNSRMVGDIMKNAMERANAIWRETRGTKPPGG